MLRNGTDLKGLVRKNFLNIVYDSGWTRQAEYLALRTQSSKFVFSPRWSSIMGFPVMISRRTMPNEYISLETVT